MPTSSATSFMDLTTLFRSSTSNPSSTTMVSVMARGCAPIMARSFTAPHADSFPMSPPGKNNGSTV